MATFSNSIFRVLHWGPLIALGIIFSVSLCTVSCLGQWHNNREMFLDLASSFQLRSHNKMANTYDRGAASSFDNLATTSHDGASKSDWMATKEYTPTYWSQVSPYLLTVFLLLSGLTLYYYLIAMWGGPGSVPSGWQPQNPEDQVCLQYCETCCSYKPPRAHHCRQCGRCVPKMDHHCPWINTCVGHNNHATFTFFLLFAVLGCSVATAVLGPSVYWAMYRRWYFIHGPGSVPLIFLSLWGLLLNMFVLGLAIGVVIAVGMLLYFQVRSVLRNRTAIEDWILEKALHRHSEAGLPPFLYPYDLGRWMNVKEVFGGAWCRSKGDGISWTVRVGCHQYTLTLEQLAQKACKRARAVRCVVRRPYSGRWLPITHGLRVLCQPPCTDDPRVPLMEGDIVVVTRWKRYWLYGDCIPRQQQQQQEQLQQQQQQQLQQQQQQQQDPNDSVSNGALKTQLNAASPDALNVPKSYRNRGWFPRHCVVPLLEDVYRSNVPEPYNAWDFGSVDKLKERDFFAVRKADVSKKDDCGSRGGEGSKLHTPRGPGEVSTRSVVGKEGNCQQVNVESRSKVEEHVRHRRNVENWLEGACVGDGGGGGRGGGGGDGGSGGRHHHASAGLRRRRV